MKNSQPGASPFCSAFTKPKSLFPLLSILCVTLSKLNRYIFPPGRRTVREATLPVAAAGIFFTILALLPCRTDAQEKSLPLCRLSVSFDLKSGLRLLAGHPASQAESAEFPRP